MIFVEALAGGPALLARPKMPLFDIASGVTLTLKQFGYGHFAGLEGVGRAPEDNGAETRALRIAPGHERALEGVQPGSTRNCVRRNP
jgi:hypothetical protein